MMCNKALVFIKRVLLLALILSLILAASIIINFLTLSIEPYGNDFGSFVEHKPGNFIDIYIPGAGFSGFFYILGRLQALHNAPADYSSAHEYWCFSAGCLALVTSLLKLPVETAIEIALSSRDEWIKGKIGRYDVVEYFVNGLLSHLNKEEAKAKDKKLYTTIECAELPFAVIDGVHPIHRLKNSQESEIDSVVYYSDSESNGFQDFLPRINVITSTWT